MAQTTGIETLTALLDTAADGILLTDPEGRVLFANRSFRDLAALLELGAGGVANDFERLLPAGGTVQLEDTGSGRSFRLDASPPEGTVGRAWTLCEVTHERADGRRYHEAVAAIGHDLRTPLTSMAGFIGLLRDGDSGPLNPEQQRYLEIANRAADRLQQLVTELLAVSVTGERSSEEAE